MIDGDQERRLTDCMDLARELRQLFGRFIIAREENDAAHQRMRQTPAVFVGQRRARHVEHDGSVRNL